MAAVAVGVGGLLSAAACCAAAVRTRRRRGRDPGRAEGGALQQTFQPPAPDPPEFLLVPPLPRHGMEWGVFRLVPPDPSGSESDLPQWEHQDHRIALCRENGRWVVVRWAPDDGGPQELAAIAAHAAASPAEVSVWRCPYGVLPVSWPDRVCTAAHDLAEAAEWARRLRVDGFFDEYGDPPQCVEQALAAMPVCCAEAGDCPVCHSALGGVPARRLECAHVYHRSCIDRWFRLGHADCPMCRAPVPELKSLAGGGGASLRSMLGALF